MLLFSYAVLDTWGYGSRLNRIQSDISNSNNKKLMVLG
jgi:hypothetical protein